MLNSVNVIITFYLTLQLNFCVNANGEYIGNDCKQLFDIIFVIDGSDSINAVDYKTLQLAMEGLVDRLNIGNDNGRMGMVVYSRDIALEVPLSSDKEYLRFQAKMMPHPRDGTHTQLGIETMRKLFMKNNRLDVPMVGIVVTDGISIDPASTAREAALAKEYGINMYSVGVTNLTDIRELRAIASRPTQVLTVESFDMLASNLEAVVKLVCPTTTTTTTATTPTTTTTTPTTTTLTTTTTTPTTTTTTPTTTPTTTTTTPTTTTTTPTTTTTTPTTTTTTPTTTTTTPTTTTTTPTTTTTTPTTTTTTPTTTTTTPTTTTTTPTTTTTTTPTTTTTTPTTTTTTPTTTTTTTPTTTTTTPTTTTTTPTTTTTTPTTTSTTPTTTTTTPTTTTPTTTHGPDPRVCNFCEMKEGVGFNRHPEDCDKYVKCYFGYDGKVKAVYKQCPFGMFWDQGSTMCKGAWEVSCPKDKCSIPNMLSYPFGTMENCRAHWICSRGKSVPMCCSEGYGYVPFKGCIPQPGCQDSCLLQEKQECNKRMIWDQLDKYEEFLYGYGWVKKCCESGYIYDSDNCKCLPLKNEDTHGLDDQKDKVCKAVVHIPFDNSCLDTSGNNIFVENNNVQLVGNGLGYFDGNANLVIPRFPEMQSASTFVIKIRYLDLPSTHMQGLVSNGDCKTERPTMFMIKGRTGVNFMAESETNQFTTFHLPAKPVCWNEAYFINDSDTLEGYVNGKSCKRWTYGPIKMAHGGLNIGAVNGFQNFYGFMDYVTIYYCQKERKYR